MTAGETTSSMLFSNFGGKNNERLSKLREDGIAKSGRKMTNGFECIIMNVCVSKQREEGIAKEGRNVLIMNVCVYVYLWLYVFTCVCV